MSGHRHVMNIFRLAADFIHLFSIVLLWMKMSRSRSCSGKNLNLFLKFYFNSFITHPPYNTLSHTITHRNIFEKSGLVLGSLRHPLLGRLLIIPPHPQHNSSLQSNHESILHNLPILNYPLNAGEVSCNVQSQIGHFQGGGGFGSLLDIGNFLAKSPRRNFEFN